MEFSKKMSFFNKCLKKDSVIFFPPIKKIPKNTVANIVWFILK